MHRARKRSCVFLWILNAKLFFSSNNWKISVRYRCWKPHKWSEQWLHTMASTRLSTHPHENRMVVLYVGKRNLRTASVVPVCLWHHGSHGVPPPSPSLLTKTQTTSPHPQAREVWMNTPCLQHTHTHVHKQSTNHTYQVKRYNSGNWEWVRFLFLSLSLVFSLFNHLGLKGHAEFNRNKEGLNVGRCHYRDEQRPHYILHVHV